MGSGKRPHGLLNSVFNEMVHISTMIHAIAKLFTPMCSPRDGDHQKNTGLLIGNIYNVYQLYPALTNVAPPPPHPLGYC